MTGAERAALARSFVGTPYRHQASLPGVALDCLGLVRALWRAEFGAEPMPIPPYRPGWRDPVAGDGLARAAHELLAPVEAGEAGDVVLFRFRRDLPAKHCGVLLAPDRFVHAIERVGTVETALDAWWRARTAGVFRFPQGAVETPVG